MVYAYLMTKDIKYPTTAASLRKGFVIPLPGFADRTVKVEKVEVLPLSGFIYVRLDNGMSDVYLPDEPVTVISDN